MKGGFHLLLHYENDGVAFTKIEQCFIIGLNEIMPNGYRMIDHNEVVEHKEEICKHLEQNAIVAFDHGKIAGPAYGYEIQMDYGDECGEQMIISCD